MSASNTALSLQSHPLQQGELLKVSRPANESRPRMFVETASSGSHLLMRLCPPWRSHTQQSCPLLSLLPSRALLPIVGSELKRRAGFPAWHTVHPELQIIHCPFHEHPLPVHGFWVMIFQVFEIPPPDPASIEQDCNLSTLPLSVPTEKCQGLGVGRAERAQTVQ